jgi:hypothetical protein
VLGIMFDSDLCMVDDFLGQVPKFPLPH